VVHRAVRISDNRLAAAKCVSVRKTADLEEFGVEVRCTWHAWRRDVMSDIPNCARLCVRHHVVLALLLIHSWKRDPRVTVRCSAAMRRVKNTRT
jgi:hypothetical protein